MRFCDVLQIKKGVTAIIGSGGKTSLILKLASELSEQGTVIFCTTTHILPPENMPLLLTAQPAQMKTVLKQHRCVCAASAAENGKLTASPVSLPILETLADYVLVEADGAKHLPLKAHAETEPVIPENAGTVIVVLGLSGIGKPVCEVVHRPELFCSHLGLEPQTIVTPELAAAHLQYENLHTALYLNQADDEPRTATARELANCMTCPVCAGSIEKGAVLCLR